jgi:4-hydroxybenzoate polyprenyltransferase
VRNAYVARPVIGLLRKAEHKKINLKVIDRGSGFSLRPVIKLLRPHQWLKNVLLVVPALTAVEYVFDQNILLILVLAFISFGLCASSVYVLNDLIDIDNDRAHNRKKFRPIAAGFISVPLAVSLFVSLLLSAFVLAQFLSPKFFAILLLYFIITLAYSLGIKKIALVDCFVLSSLYTIRIISGAVVLDLDLTFWLVLFSFMLFLSLSFLKRVSELYAVKGMVGVEIKGRGYKSEDYGLVQTFGVSAGVTSVFLFGLYLNTPRVIGAYAKHEISILAVPVLLFWVFWVWFSAQRGRMHDDPVIFAIKDLVSIISGICFILVLAVARF